ncbi:hypothetical protein EJ08DRAFT_586435 [Tothia fuscella]|uniref:Uncharacterized protein n=1 Tax=Tothia fuscella TaxID=1048955 RepID=A0A9P4NVJ0_9PEZI|nr:hypothetical protein EJ08DRAFT_586435 [Tothia fuscella]
MEEIDLTGDSPRQTKSSDRKRKRNIPSEATSSSKSGNRKSAAIDLTADQEDAEEDGGKKKRAKKNPKKKADGEEDEEKRLKHYREKAPKSFSDIYARATTQRMFVLDRTRGGEMSCPTETLKIAGSTGNVYTITIDQVPSCDCPHAKKGNQCKHIVFALSRVLRAPAKLQYQVAFLKSELQEIFSKAPPIVTVDASEPEVDANRKAIGPEDNCPICFMEFENGQEGTVYCKAACGNNIHKDCMDQWAASRQRSSAPVTCPFCRTTWETANEGLAKTVATAGGTVNSDGYVNVASELGLSGRRDYSSYHSYWVRREARNGRDVGEYDDYQYPNV